MRLTVGPDNFSYSEIYFQKEASVLVGKEIDRATTFLETTFMSRWVNYELNWTKVFFIFPDFIMKSI